MHLPTSHPRALQRAWQGVSRPGLVRFSRPRPAPIVFARSGDSTDPPTGSLSQDVWLAAHGVAEVASQASEPSQNQSSSLSLDLGRFQAFEAYKRELAKPEHEVCLLTCATLIARACKYPRLEVEEVTAQVDRLAAEVKKQLPKVGTLQMIALHFWRMQDTHYPMQMLRVIISVLYAQKGFHGNTIDYYDDDNSYINMVLLNKAGIPITLALLFMEVAKRVGLPMKGVNLPAHFMLSCDGLGVLVDAYAGEVVLVDDAAAKLSALMQAEIKLDSDQVMNSKGVPARQFLMRMLNNLKQVYLMTSRADMALRIIRLMRVTQPMGSEMRDEGLCLYAMTRYREAADLLSEYLKVYPKADDALMVYAVLEGCRELVKEQAEETRIKQEQQQQQQQAAQQHEEEQPEAQPVQPRAQQHQESQREQLAEQEQQQGSQREQKEQQQHSSRAHKQQETQDS